MPILPQFSPLGDDTYAVCVLCAADATIYFDRIRATGEVGGDPVLPPADDAGIAYLKGAAWSPVGQLRADDNIITKSDDVYFGVVLKCEQAIGPFQVGDLIVAVKGTSDVAEWEDDASSVFKVGGGAGQPGDVAFGFWTLYRSLTFNDFGNADESEAAASAITNLLRQSTGRLYIVGHSLGAALATYLTYDVVNGLKTSDANRVFPYFFASPKTGTLSHVQNYKTVVGFYNLVNYTNDVVPKLPFSFEGYSALLSGSGLHNVKTLDPTDDSWVPNSFDFIHNHSAVLYARLLDPTNAVASAMSI